MHTETEEGVAFEDCAPAQPEPIAARPPQSVRVAEPPQVMVAVEDNRDDFIARWERERARQPNTTVQLGVCRHCGASLGTTADDKVIPIGRMFLPNICCQSCSDAGKAKLEEQAEIDRAQRFAGIVPKEFLTWDVGKGNNIALQEAKQKFSITARRGLILHGPSGRCKTRIMWELVKQVAGDKDGFSFCVMDAFEAATTGIPKEAYTAEFLFIDDLGNEPATHKFKTNMLHLFRRRFDWHRPITITTQLTGVEMMARYFNDASAQAIARRIRENCANVSCLNN